MLFVQKQMLLSLLLLSPRGHELQCLCPHMHIAVHCAAAGPSNAHSGYCCVSRSGSEPNVKDGVAEELLEDGSDLSDAPGQVSDHARTNADQTRHRPELLHADAIRDLHTSLHGCVF